MYLEEILETPAYRDRWGVPGPEKRRVLLRISGPEALRKDVTEEFVVELVPLPALAPLSNPLSHYLLDFDFALTADRGTIRLDQKPDYLVVAGRNDTYERVVDMDMNSRQAWTFVSNFSQSFVAAIPFGIGALASGLKELTHIDNIKDASEPDWEQFWAERFLYDVFPIPKPRYTRPAGLSRAYRIHVPISRLADEGSISFVMSRLHTNRPGTGEQVAVFDPIVVPLMKGEARVLSTPVPVDLRQGHETVDLGVGLHSFALHFDYEITHEGDENELRLSVLSRSNSAQAQHVRDLAINDVSIALDVPAQLGYVSGMPRFTNASGRYESHIPVRALAWISAAESWSNFLVSLVPIAGHVSKAASIYANFDEAMAAAIDSRPFSESLQAWWISESERRIYELPAYRNRGAARDQYSDEPAGFQISIPLTLHETVLLEDVILHLSARISFYERDPYGEAGYGHRRQDFIVSAPLEWNGRRAASSPVRDRWRDACDYHTAGRLAYERFPSGCPVPDRMPEQKLDLNSDGLDELVYVSCGGPSTRGRCTLVIVSGSRPCRMILESFGYQCGVGDGWTFQPQDRRRWGYADIKTDDGILAYDGTEYSTYYGGVESDRWLENVARRVLDAIHRKDFEALARYVHPVKGLRFSPNAWVDAERHVVVERDDVKTIFESSRRHHWGWREATDDMPIEMTFRRYYDEYLYLRPFRDGQITINDVNHPATGRTNFGEVYDHGIIVEVFRSPSAEGMGDWGFLRMAFEEYRGDLFLIGLGNQYWSP